MPKNIIVNLATFKDKKKWTIAGKEYEVKFAPNPSGPGFVAYDVPDPVAALLLSGKFPAFCEYKVGGPEKYKELDKPLPYSGDGPLDEEKPKRRKVSG